MCKKSEKVNTNAFTASPPFPKAPWVYVSAPWGDNAHVDKVKGMIDAFILEYTWKDDFYSNKITRVDNLLTKIDQYKDSRGVSKKALMIVDQLNNLDLESCRKIEVNTKIREHAAKCGRTFASANLHLIESTRKHEMEPWGPNHLDLNVAGLTEKQVADKVYKWLCTANSFLDTNSSKVFELTRRNQHYSHCHPTNRAYLSPHPGQTSSH